MGITWCREAIDRDLEVSKESGSGSRTFLVKVDDPTTSLATIRSQPGISIGDVHPADGTLLAESISVKPSGDSGLLYAVTISYAVPSAKDDNNDGGGSGEPGSIDGHTAYWGGSSSVTSEPIYRDVNGVVMCNSAGDPLEGLEAERAQFHLTKVTFYDTHAGANGWVAHSRTFTNAVNGDVWNGGLAGQWKCQGSSAKLGSDNLGPDGAKRYFWEVSWDFAYRADYWRLEPWDIGFNELVDENGDPAPTYGISAGDGGSGGSGDDGPCPGNLGRRAIKGQDGKPVRQPVALDAGVAKAACFRPDALLFNVYPFENFGPTFGEVFTP